MLSSGHQDCRTTGDFRLDFPPCRRSSRFQPDVCVNDRMIFVVGTARELTRPPVFLWPRSRRTTDRGSRPLIKPQPMYLIKTSRTSFLLLVPSLRSHSFACILDSYVASLVEMRPSHHRDSTSRPAAAARDGVDVVAQAQRSFIASLKPVSLFPLSLFPIVSDRRGKEGAAADARGGRDVAGVARAL